MKLPQIELQRLMDGFIGIYMEPQLKLGTMKPYLPGECCVSSDG